MTRSNGCRGFREELSDWCRIYRKLPRCHYHRSKPIGTSIRSTPATYLGIMDEIRKLFAKANNVTPSWFSYNSKGACPICKGTGKIVYDMAFADSVEVVCEECGVTVIILKRSAIVIRISPLKRF